MTMHPFRIFILLGVMHVSVVVSFVALPRASLIHREESGSCWTSRRVDVLKTDKCSSRISRTRMNFSEDVDSSSDGFEHTEELQQRLKSVRKRVSMVEENRPPNSRLTPQQIVRALLAALYTPDDPLPESGFRLLLRSATVEWREHIRKSVGAPDYATEESIASALGTAISRPKNQFAILVGADQDGTEKFSIINKRPRYSIHFPTEIVDYNDGNCWLECQLRKSDDDKLLVIMGWEMKQREEDKAWLIHGIDWQDFRDNFRPGTGREEWMRICG